MGNQSLERSLDNEMLIKTEDENWQQLQSSFAELYKIQDENQRLYKLLAIVKQYDIPLDIFRCMFEIYCKQQSEALYEKSAWKLPFLRAERFFEAMARLLEEMDLFKVLEKLSSLSIIFAVAIFLWEMPQRTEQAQYQAWKVINENKSQKSSGGRINALKNLNKDKVSLAGLEIKDAILPGVDLNKADLFKANLKNSILNNAQLDNANLKEANLSSADLSNAKLRRTQLSGADLSNAKLSGADLSEADLKRLIPEANENQVQSSGTILKGADLRNAILTNADLRNVDLRNANLDNAVLDNVNLQGALYDEKTKFPSGFDVRSQEAFKIGSYAALSQKDLHLVDLSDANLSDANLSDANLSDANLRNANLRNADLKKANLMNADLRGADLKDADLKGADLKRADLKGADLKGADLRGADLRGADLKDADVNLTKFTDFNFKDGKITGEQLRRTKNPDAAILGESPTNEGGPPKPTR
jgi:uncharacterized protein YjbI with pentapeptide repeats